MITTNDITEILDACKSHDYRPSKQDIAFWIMEGIIGTEAAGFLLWKGPLSDPSKYRNSSKSKLIRKMLNAKGIFDNITSDRGEKTIAGINEVKEKISGVDAVTADTNKKALIQQISDIERLIKTGDFDREKGYALIAQIRFRLQDKFELERSEDERRIIVVPHKFDMVCPHTNRECTFRPSKAECIKQYGLVEKSGKDE